ncbi:hypothetical protein [Streptomyces sp. NPDC019507]|uniref:hypothetical protein n=1 Tax=Streptomyces sp. NPDC019507 TaxID=3154689 RepID=UPI0033E0DE3A
MASLFTWRPKWNGQLIELADTGIDVSDLGNGPRPGGLRRMDAAGGWFYFLVAPRDPLIVIVRINRPSRPCRPVSCRVPLTGSAGS